MAEFEDPSHETRRDPGVTHPGRTASETRRDADTSSATRRDGPPEPPTGDPLLRLPGPLAQRFTVVGELPVQGAESDLLLVRDTAGDGHDEYVVKIFRRGYGADREVWRKLPELASDHVVRILETGHADGRDYEVIEYAPAGNLRSLMADRLPAAAVVSQLAAGLDCLHQAGIVHRDLKPENVLVASARPLRLVITDFGLSKVIEQSVVFASSSRTLAYAAPESLSGQVSPARDWWSLGMIVREVAIGRAPFTGMSETAVVDHLATRPIDNDDIEDPRLRLLCQGLLTRDPRRRWDGAQVARWLDGESPAVAAEPAGPERRAPAGPGLPFAGRHFTDRAALARALVENWDTGTRHFFARGASGDAWRSLRDWLSAFDDSRDELIDRFLIRPLPPDVKLLHLVRWLDPSLPPHLLGRQITADDLPVLAGLAGDAAHPDHHTATVIGRYLWDHELLPVLAGGAGAAELAEIDARWRGRVEAWDRLIGWLHGRLPPPVAARLPEAGAPGRDDPPVVLLTLLALAARPVETTRVLADAAARARSSVREPVEWFQWLADGAGDDPLRLLAVVRAAPDAAVEVEARLRDRQATQQQTAGRRRHWEEAERRRLAGRRAAVTRAVLWCLPLIVIWFGGSWLAVQLVRGQGAGSQAITGVSHTAADPTALFLVVAAIAFLVQVSAEVLVAARQAGDYLALGPWSGLAKALGATGRGLSAASQSLSGTARRTGRRGCGTALLVAFLPLLLLAILFTAVLSLLWLLWLTVLVVVPLAHTISAGIRLSRWRQAHERAERDALGVTV